MTDLEGFAARGLAARGLAVPGLEPADQRAASRPEPTGGMIVLGIDTSGVSASAAIRTPGRLGAASATEPRAHARVLPDLITTAAREAGTSVDDITHVAVARGPGMFTGMRVGLVAARVFAMARGLELAGVSTLHAAAHRVIERHGPDQPFAVAVDARRREVFLQHFQPSGDPLGPVETLPVAEIAAAAGSQRGGLFLDAGLAASHGAGAPLETGGLAADVAAVGALRWQRGLASEPPDPIYVRRPDTSAPNPARSVLGQP